MAIRQSLAQRTKDRKKAASVVRRFNAKITRITKKNPALGAMQPPRLTVNEVMETLKQDGRQVFNRNLKMYERYLRPGAEAVEVTKEGVPIINWYRKETNLAVRLLNQRRAKEAAAHDLENNKQAQRSELAETVRPITNYAEGAKSPAEYKYRLGSMLRAVAKETPDSKAELYKKNMIKAIKTIYGSDHPAVALAERVDARILYESAWANNALDIQFHYDANEFAYALTEEMIIEDLTRLAGGSIST